MTASTTANERARALLWKMRETPMKRGALSTPARQLRAAIARSLVANGVPEALAQRVAFQLVVKTDRDELRDERLCHELGVILRSEIDALKERVGLAERQIVTVLPKLSAHQIEEFLDELTRAERRIARTVLDAAIDAAEPVATGRRYLAEYRLVARQLHAIEPNIARTLANATFTAGMPLGKAMEHLQKFLTSIARQKDHPDVARLLARVRFRAD
ncbi:MAG TPA: hypothetical protein VFP91_19290 [Vicinamibacterales bacterium]|nr:hypothetical protein [Vicinamibacterales bacterium]